jgi:hypothetical protein
MQKELDVINKGFVDFRSRFDLIDNKLEKINNNFSLADEKAGTLKSDLQKEILQSKYDLVKWIVAGIIMNGVVGALLKYIG